MSRYRTVYVQIWNDNKFNSLSDDAKLLFLYLLTTPLSSPFGAFKASKPALADDLNWTMERFSKPFDELLGKPLPKRLPKPLIAYDEPSRFLMICNFLKYNKPHNLNVLKGWSKVYEELPDCALKLTLYESLSATIHERSKPLHKPFRERFAKPLETVTETVTQTVTETVVCTGTGTVSGTGTGTGTKARAEIEPCSCGFFNSTVDHDCTNIPPDDNYIDPESWEPSKIDIDAVRIMGITQEKIDQWKVYFRQYIRECELSSKKKTLTPATIGKSWRRFCQNQRPEDMVADNRLDQAISESSDRTDAKEKTAKRAKTNGFDSIEQERDFHEAIAKYKNDRKLKVAMTTRMFDSLPDNLKARAYEECGIEVAP